LLKLKVMKEPTGQIPNGLFHNQTLKAHQKEYMFLTQSLINPEQILHLTKEIEEQLSTLKPKEMINQKEPIKVSTN